MTPSGRRLLSISTVLVFALAVIVFGYLLRSIINPLLVALLIAYVLDPVVDFMERKGVPRARTVVYIYLIGFLVVVFFGGMLVPAAISGISDLSTAIAGQDGYIDKLAVWVSAGGLEKFIGEEQAERAREAWPELKEKLKTNLGQVLNKIAGVFGSILEGAAATLRGIFALFSYLVLVPVYVFFILLSMDKIRKAVAEHLPAAYRERILDVARKIDASVSAFFRGRLIICLVKGILIAIGLSICGVKFALPIGILAGLGSLIPFLGGIFATVPSFVIVLLDYPDPWVRLIGIAVVVVVAEAVEGFVLTPAILSKETGLHPLILLLSMFIAGEIFGFFGVLLAVPIASIVKILFSEFVLPEIRTLAKN